MALLLSLFGDAEMKGEGVASLSPAGVVSSFHSEALSPSCGVVLDPCKSCPLSGLCDPDDCGRHAFPLDSPFPPSRFRNLGEYVNFLKHYDWA